jgi:CshA-type fibril repeat protein
MTVAGEGTYTLNTTTGIVSFTAVAGVAPGSLTPISYKVVDQVGNTATSTLTPVVPVPPTAVADTSTGGWDSNQTISVLGNDTVSATPATVKLCSAAELAVTPVSAISCTQTSLAVANEGTYTVNGDGSVTFDPLPTFTGTVAAPPTYQVADAAGQKARATITPTVAAPPAPGANPDTQVVAPVSAGGTGSVSFDPLLGAGGMATGAGTPTVCLIDPSTSQCAGSNTVTIAGAGTYTLNPSTKVVTFALAAGVTNAGSLAAVTYQVTDSFGQTATSTLTPVIPAAPTAVADTSSGYQDVNQVISILGNDSAAGSGNALVPGSVKLCDPATSPPQVSPNCAATSLTVSGEGTYTVNANGSVTFDPLSSFTGTATPINYQVSDAAGLKASSTITPTVIATPAGSGVVLPTATSDTKTGSYGQSMTFGFSSSTGLTGTNAGNDAAGSAPSSSTSGNVTTSYSTPALDPASVRLCSSGQVLPNCAATSLTTADGTYSVNGDGSVTFTPAAGFTGTATQPVAYQVSNTYTRSVATTTTTTTTTDPTATCLSPTCTATPTNDANNVAPNGAGYIPTWSVADTATVTTPLAYSASALLTPTISAPAGPSASNDTATTTAGTPVTVSPWTNDTAGSYALRPGSILLCGSGETAPACTKTTVTIAGQGTFSVDTSTGVVTFTPESGFTGTSSVPYRILDWNGAATNAVITITVNPAPSNSNSTPSQSATPDTSPSTTPPTTPSTTPTPTNPTTPPRRPAVLPAPSKNGPKATPQIDATIVNPDEPVVLDPLSDARPSPGETIKPSSLRIWNGTTWTTSFSDPGVGTWTVTDGKVSFMPEPNFTGTAKITFRISDTSGARAGNVLTVHVAPREALASLRRIPGIRPTAIDAGRLSVSVTVQRCPSDSSGGAAVATITVNGVTVPIKAVSLSSSGVLAPPASNAVAAVSRQHAGLNAKQGTSVLTWHVRYGAGCPGSLNSLLTLPAGSTFSIRNGATVTDYEITRQVTVAKGDHRASWFGQGGPHRLVLLTCNGLRNGKFTETTAIFARPVTK